MAFKPNYNQQRTERERAKSLKKQEKLKRRQDGTEKAEPDDGADPEATRDQPPRQADGQAEG